MKKLSEHQKEFLLKHFFKNEKYAGWKSIATKLLETGRCTVSGNHCIWVGGIGNFIKLEEAKDAVGCVVYKFDLDSFLISQWYKTIKDAYASHLLLKKKEIESEYNAIVSI